MNANSWSSASRLPAVGEKQPQYLPKQICMYADLSSLNLWFVKINCIYKINVL